jgi:hypothetical protein
MAGILIYGSYEQFYSFVIADNDIYNATRREMLNNVNNKLYFNKGNLSLQKLENVREKVSEIVKRLNNKEKVNVKKELSNCFN